MSYTLVYMTAGSVEEARRIGRALVEARLAACVNVLGEIDSFYWWEGAVQNETEAALIAKTRNNLVDSLIAHVKGMHGYTCPAVIALPVAQGNPEFLAWIDNETV